jgi:hypothetical protein
MLHGGGFVANMKKFHLALLALSLFAAFSARVSHAQTGLELDIYGGDNTGGSNIAFPQQAEAAFSTSSSYTAFFSGLTPTLSTFTGADSQSALNFPSMFTPYGFNFNSDYVARMQGFISISTAGSYTFSTGSDDGSVLYIDGSLVVNNNQFQGETFQSGVTSLSVGLHTIDIGYYQGGGGENLEVEYAGPDSDFGEEDIPNDVLFTIPEPSTWALVTGVAALAWAGFRRRRPVAA